MNWHFKQENDVTVTNWKGKCHLSSKDWHQMNSWLYTLTLKNAPYPPTKMNCNLKKTLCSYVDNLTQTNERNTFQRGVILTTLLCFRFQKVTKMHYFVMHGIYFLGQKGWNYVLKFICFTKLLLNNGVLFTQSLLYEAWISTMLQQD